MWNNIEKSSKVKNFNILISYYRNAISHVQPSLSEWMRNGGIFNMENA